MKREVLIVEDIKIFIYSFELMDSRMYMIREQQEMLVVDPCIDEALLRDAEGIQKVYVLLTHEHYDHISGVNWLREHFECQVYTGDVCAKRIQSPKENLSSRFAFLFIFDKEKYDYVRHNISLPYICNADHSYHKYGKLIWGEHEIEFYEVGGHSPGSCLILMDKKLLFAGDNVLNNGNELRGSDANKEEYVNVVVPFLEKLSEKIYVLPGHGTE